MKFTSILKVLISRSSFLLISFLIFGLSVQAGGRDFIQFKIYSLEDEQQEQGMDKFLEEAYLPAMHRAGIQHVGVLKPIEDSVRKIYVIIPFKSLDEFEQVDAKLKEDKRYQKDGADYSNAAHDNAPYSRIESVLLRSFKSVPNYKVPEHEADASDRIYELRSYEGATEKLYEKKVEMFDNGESQLFIDLEFQPVFFGEVIVGPVMPNLMYMITFENEADQKQHWDAFRVHPIWQSMKSDKQYANTVSHIDKYLLRPTKYSDL